MEEINIKRHWKNSVGILDGTFFLLSQIAYMFIGVPLPLNWYHQTQCNEWFMQ